MRRDFIVLATLAIVGMAYAGTQPGKNGSAKGSVILVVGDSLSAEYGLARGTGWVTLLEQRLAQEKIPATVVNASVSGDTTAGGRARLAALLKLHQPTHVVLELGSNDALRGLPLANTQDNLDWMTEQAQAAGARVLLVGAGGAAAGVLGPLLQAGVRHITIANRTVAKAEALVASHSALAALQKAELLALAPQGLEGDFDVIINATASSLAGDAVPVPASVLRPGSLAYDMMYGPAAQGFLDWAQAHGAVARDGLGMLVEQAAEAFAIWRGVRPPSAQVLEELRRAPH